MKIQVGSAGRTLNFLPLIRTTKTSKFWNRYSTFAPRVKSTMNDLLGNQMLAS